MLLTQLATWVDVVKCTVMGENAEIKLIYNCGLARPVGIGRCKYLTAESVR